MHADETTSGEFHIRFAEFELGFVRIRARCSRPFPNCDSCNLFIRVNDRPRLARASALFFRLQRCMACNQQRKLASVHLWSGKFFKKENQPDIHARLYYFFFSFGYSCFRYAACLLFQTASFEYAPIGKGIPFGYSIYFFEKFSGDIKTWPDNEANNRKEIIKLWKESSLESNYAKSHKTLNAKRNRLRIRTCKFLATFLYFFSLPAFRQLHRIVRYACGANIDRVSPSNRRNVSAYEISLIWQYFVLPQAII